MAYAVAVAFVTPALLGFALPAEASVFLGPVPSHAGVSEEDVNLENNLLSQIEDVLGSEHRVFTEKRLDSLAHSLLPIFTALPKNENGKLGHAAVSYALYRLFVKRHAWFVKGLEPFKAFAEWNSTSAVSVIDQRVPAYITGLFHTRMGDHGFGLHELAVLAATLEHLVHKESLLRLSSAYTSLKFSKEDILSIEDLDEVMDTYMAMYILDSIIPNISNLSTAQLKFIRANITTLYPDFPKTQSFLREVSGSVAPARDYLYYSDVANIVEEVGDRYGRWQDYECRTMKDVLVEMEDRSMGGAGRVRLADFYKASLHDGQWQLSESIDYLRKLGALDESSPDNLKVIIPNYINGPSNCVASSSYYSVCCINECEEILSHLETQVAAPEATPARIASVISQLPSSTLAGNRTLAPWLLRRLDDVAEHHGGLVPLHGRLFVQWLHYAYPRECPYPHVMDATSPQTPKELMKEAVGDLAATDGEKREIIELPLPPQKRVEETGDMEEVLQLQCAMWTMEEELVVVREDVPHVARSQPWLRGLAFVAAVGSAAFAVVRMMHRELSIGQRGTEKYYV